MNLNLQRFAATSSKFVTDNSPAILTGIGVAGTLTTAFLTGKAAYRAALVIDDYEREIAEGKRAGLIPDFTFKEKFLVTWKLYIPPVLMGCVTVTSIIAANRIGTGRATALATAYTLSERAFSEYKEKVVETVGKNKEQKVRDEVAQNRVNQDPPTTANTIIVDKDATQLFREEYSGRYFKSSVENVRAAQNIINQDINLSGYASLSDFYVLLGIEANEAGNQLGWNQKLLDVDLSSAGVYEGVPFINLSYYTRPESDFDRFHG